jgi:predicted MFS family arabinose efflux permease
MSEFFVGILLGTFSLLSFSIRPFIGRWADEWNVLGVLLIGTVLLGVFGLAMLIPVFWLLFVANGVRGVGWACLNTGSNAMLAHIAPPARRGEASGYFTLFQTTANTLGAPLALWLLGAWWGGFDIVFLAAGLSALVGTAIAFGISKDAVGVDRRSSRGRGPGDAGRAALYDRGVLLPSVLLLCLTLIQPATIAFLPLYALELGIDVGSVSWYYLAHGATALLFRALLGRVSDRAGRGAAIAAGYLFVILGLVVLLAASGIRALVAGGVVLAIGQALAQPTTLALAIDRSNPSRRGTAMASYTMAYQIGMGFGAVLWGAVIEMTAYEGMYAGSILIVAMGLVIVGVNWQGLRRAASAG